MTLRPLLPDDALELRRIHATPEVARWWAEPEDGFPWTDEPDATRWAIVLDGAVAGLIQFNEQPGPRHRHAAIDVFLDPALHGRGLGTEAVRRVVRYLIDERGHHRITIDPATENAAAVRAYEKVGFERVGVMRRYERDAHGPRWHDSLLMELLADDNVPATVDGGQLPRVTFYSDLGSPYAYLTAERLGQLLPEPVAWQPILLGGLFQLTGRSSWSLGDAQRRRAGMAEIERRARAYELPPLHWPARWPSDYLFAMRAATFAFAAGRGREFTLQAFRDAFGRGRDLGVAEHVLAAARAAGLDPDAVARAAQDPEVKQRLREATDTAHARGVIGVPTLAVGDELFWGDDRLEDAAAQLTRASSA